MSDIPRRRLRLTLDLGADDLDSVCKALRRIETDLLVNGDEYRESTTGGWSDGYHLTLTVTDPEQTGDRYREQLEAWRQERLAARYPEDDQ